MRGNNIRHKKAHAGFTMFFAVLVAGLALAIGIAIYDLVVRELALTGTTAQSQYAIYAADSGAECALYWDMKFKKSVPSDADGSAFATSTDYTQGGVATTGQISCAGQDIVAGAAPLSQTWQLLPPTNPSATAATTTFYFSLGSTKNDPCATVEVAKYKNASGFVHTTITSHGYNTCTKSAVIRLERVLQVNY